MWADAAPKGGGLLRVLLLRRSAVPLDSGDVAERSGTVDRCKDLSFDRPFRMVFQLMTFQGVRYSLFSFNQGGVGGYADFDAIDVHEPNPRGLMKPIPYGKRIELVTHGPAGRSISTSQDASASQDALRPGDGPGTLFEVVNIQLGRVALRAPGGFASVASDGQLSVRDAAPGNAESFQWMETFTGELILMSLSTHRYVRLDRDRGVLMADSPGPHSNGRDGVRWEWRVAESKSR